MQVQLCIQATKAAVKTFSDGLRIDTITDIKVTTIQPGIVETDFSCFRFQVTRTRQPRFIKVSASWPKILRMLSSMLTKQPRRVQVSDMTIIALTNKPGFDDSIGGMKGETYKFNSFNPAIGSSWEDLQSKLFSKGRN